MVFGVSKDPISVAVAVETIESVRAEKDLIIAALRAHSALLTKQLEAALYRIDQMARQIFCRSSERYDHPDQQRIDLGAVTPAAPAGPVTVIPPLAKGIVAGKESRAAKPKRKPIPDTMERVHLPARELSLAERTLADGRILIPVGEETNERIHFIEPKFIAEVEHRIVYGLPNAADGLLANNNFLNHPLTITAPAAAQIIIGGLPTTALLVQIAFAKFGLHLPLHRQSKDFSRLGCEIAKSTMCGWLTTFATFLNPVLKALEKQVLASNLLYSDDIPEDMLDPGKGKTKIIRFWSYLGHGPDGSQLPQVLFSFTEDRAGRHPSDMLANYHGALMADALAQYDRIVDLNRMLRLLCWSHARRGFHNARHTDPRCHEILILIKKLAAAEQRAKEQRDNKKLNYFDACRWRWRLRQNYSVHVLNKIKQRLDDWEPLRGKNPATPDSPLGKAVMYSLTRWEQLTHYADTGDLPIDNNPAENVQRPIAVGRKNHLFIGSESGGHNAACFYSLIQSCRLQNIDPVAYLRDISERLLAGDINYDALTPAAMALAKKKIAEALASGKLTNCGS
jgi:transposase